MTTDIYTPQPAFEARGYARSWHAPEGERGERLLAVSSSTGAPVDLGEHLACYGRIPSFTPHTGEHPLIEATARAGLTGRGGAGFPTAKKLRAVAGAKKADRRIACTGHGLCAELLPEHVALDEWGYPIQSPDPITDKSETRHAQRAVAACPALAMRLEAARG